MSPEFLVVGNWKMNGVSRSLDEILQIDTDNPNPKCSIVICPPAILISRIKSMLSNSKIRIGGQDCHPEEYGAHTGDQSAEQFVDAGAEYIIVGHSERRINHGETNLLIKRKVKSVFRAGLKAILCVGESEVDRQLGKEKNQVGSQVESCIPEGASSSNLIVAYEPVWAIGTGRTPTLPEIKDMHHFIRQTCIQNLGQDTGQNISLLYGGSVNKSNSLEIFSIQNVNGALVGGASLKASDFSPIIKSVQ